MCTIRMKPTEYEPTPPTHYCFRIDEKTKTVLVPLGLWNEFYETPPNDDFVYPADFNPGIRAADMQTGKRFNFKLKNDAPF